MNESAFSKVVTAQEMARIEKIAIDLGSDAAAFMLEAGEKIAHAAEKLLIKDNKKSIVLLIGKGNKGGDAFVAGIHLLQKGYKVRAITFEDSSHCSELNQRFSGNFVKVHGKLERYESFDFAEDDLIIDGLFGTGFQGKTIEWPIGLAIDCANASGKPILAIDIPSGLNGTTGESANHVIKATETISLGFFKIGFFLKSGYNWVGKLRLETFGLPANAEEEAHASAFIPKIEELKLPPMHRTQHKYERGFVVGFGGSLAFKGAIKLSGLAALHAGAGIVKLFTLEDVGPVADELICQLWDAHAWKEALVKASALFIGPGLGRSKLAKAWLENHLHTIEKPCVVDADALFFLTEIKRLPKHCLLTPHRGEMLHLLKETKADPNEEAFLQRCQTFVDEKQLIIVLKGAPTFILSPASIPIIVPRGDPGMATAGSGDVLTGILASLLSQGMSLIDAAVLGVTMHALSGEAAAVEKTSYGYTASDLIDYLPKAIEPFIAP